MAAEDGSDSFRENNDNGSDVVFEYICSVHASTNEVKEAVKYCIECKGFCCLSCVKSHASFPTLKGHNLVETSNLHALGIAPGPSGIVRVSSSVPTKRCCVHPTEIVDKYCRNHDVVGCSSCLSTDHRTCTDIHSITDIVSCLHKKSDVDRTKAEVQVSRDNVANISKKNEEFVKKLDEVRKIAEDNLATYIERMKTALDGFKGETQSKIADEHKEQREEMITEKEKVVNVMKSIESTSEKMERAGGNIAQEFVCMKLAQTKIRELRSLDHQIKNKSDDGSKLKSNDYADKFKEYFQNLQISTENERAPEQIKSDRNSLYTVKQRNDINVRLPDDGSRCCIQGSCVTRSGSLLLVDSYNHKLKKVDLTSLSVVDNCTVNSPEDVCCVSETEVAVACYTKSVRFVSLNNQLTPTRTVELDQFCCGIACTDGKLFITDWNKSVFVYDMNGLKLQAIPQHDSVNALFCETRKLAFGSSNNRLYVCDGEANGGVVILDADGKYTGTVKDATIEGAYGVCEDGRGNMFVCGHFSHNVVQIGSCGTKVGEVLSKSSGIYSPRSLCFDYKTNRLIVTSLDDKVAMFQLQ